MPLQKPLLQRYREARAKRSSALIITLLVLVMVTILVLSLVSVIGLERVATHSSYENERARQFANMAVDEVLATLRDNIPTNTLWAAGPGHLQVFSTTGNSWTEVNLHSGTSTTNTSTGVVNINAPVLSGSGTTYPIIPTNQGSLYPDFTSPTTMNVGWIEVLQDGTIVRNGSNAEPGNDTSNNPIVGRYAYWVDTETSKLNINTAGRAQTYYHFVPNSSAMSGVGGINHTQNLTCSPTRPDLTELDGVTIHGSLSYGPAAYHYNNGSYFAGDYITNVGSTHAPISYNNWNQGSSSVANTVAAGGQRFNNIFELAQLSTDMEFGAQLSSSDVITSSQIEMNKFYLTVKSRAPEVNPWGLNKWWTEGFLPQLYPGTTAPAGLSTQGNVMNAKAYPYFPYNAASALTYPPATTRSNDGGYSGNNLNTRVVDTRFYCYPVDYPSSANPVNIATDDMQSMASYYPDVSGRQYSSFSSFVTPMMQLLNRSDWPGMPTTSFVQKYGTNECIDLCYNLYTYLSAAVAHYGPNPNTFNYDRDLDANEHYGKALLIYPTYAVTNTVTGNLPGGPAWAVQGSLLAGGNVPSRYMMESGALEEPMINEIAVTFTPTTAGYTPNTTTYFKQYDPNMIHQTYCTVMTLDGGPMWSTLYGGYTKDGTRPGFAPPIGSGDSGLGLRSGNPGGTAKYLNVAISPAIQLWNSPYYLDANTNMLSGVYMTDILVSGSGDYTPVNPTNGAVSSSPLQVSYGPTNSITAGYGNNQIPQIYYWGFPDDHPLCVPNTSPTDTVAASTNGLQLTSNCNTAPISALYPWFTAGTYWTMAYGATSGTNLTISPFYVGPFDSGSVATVTISFRLALCMGGADTSCVAYRFVPMGSNYGSAASSTYPAGNYSGTALSGSVTNSLYPSQQDQQAYYNVLTNTAWSAVLTFGVTNLSLGTASSPGTGQVCRYTVSDPRVSRYVSDWMLDTTDTTTSTNTYVNGIVPGTSFKNYVGTNTDAITGVSEDYSKLAYPQVMAYWATWANISLNSGAAPLSSSGLTSANADPRFANFANNITSFPGIGWLSILPLNIDSSQGATTNAPGGNGSAPLWGDGSGTTSLTPIPWRTISLLPQPKSQSSLPDWLLLDVFAVPYDQTYLSQTDGKINVNANVYPFNLRRRIPLTAAIRPTVNAVDAYSYLPSSTGSNPVFGNPALSNMVFDMTTNNITGDVNFATNAANSGLPSDMFVYTGEPAQMSSLENSTASITTGAVNQFGREYVMRTMAGIFTTQCSDFTVYVYAQSVKQVGFGNGVANDLVVTGEQRMHALISRETYTGNDNIPGTADDPDSVGLSYTPDWNSSWLAFQPRFKYVISDVEYINN